MKKQKRNKYLVSKDERIFDFIDITIITIFTLSVLLPFINIVALSLSSQQHIAIGDVMFWPKGFTTQNYKQMFSDPMILQAFKISVMKTVIGVVTHTFFTGVVAYAVSKNYTVGRGVLMKLGIVTMFFGGGLIPTYLLYKDLGLINSFWVYIIPALFSFYDMIIMMNFYRQIPASLEESARIDGASDWRIFIKIYLPLSIPVFAAIALFTGVGQWNDYMTAKIYVPTNRDIYPMQMYLYKIIAESQIPDKASSIAGLSQVSTKSLQLAAMIITMLPILVIYPFLQKYFVSGMTLGAVKE